tara:strand:- start:2471 stop:3616 length:1146 start_codon:yes stop_codon:yes gene_type:complete
MHIFTYIDKDATIYEKAKALGVATSQQQHQNTGLDSILEIQKYSIDGSFYNSRALVFFDMSALSSEITAGTIPATATHSLLLYNTKAIDIPLSYTLEVHPISESWEMGTGKLSDFPITQDGCNWKYKDGFLDGSGSHWATSSFATDTDFTATGSGNFGGTYYKGKSGDTDLYTHTKEYEFESTDLNIDVTPSIAAIHANSFQNQGFIIKRSDVQENNNTPYGNLQFFSRDTHTIYIPRLETKWDDSVWSTGSLDALNVDNDIILYMRGLKPEYKTSSVEKFRVYGRNRIVAKTFSTQSDFLTVQYLPSGSTFYSVRDASTDEVLIDFDDYTKVSCDSTGNFFNFRLNTLQPERYYKFLFKVVSGSSTQVFDDNKFQFKVVR